jgi:hypothetical protein
MKHVNLPKLFEPIKPESRRAFVLAEIRHSHKRVLALAAEIEVIGTALRENIITSDIALDWMEENAPGCLGFIPACVRVFPGGK